MPNIFAREGMQMKRNTFSMSINTTDRNESSRLALLFFNCR